MKQINRTNIFRYILFIMAVLVCQVVWAYDIVTYSLTTNITSTSADVLANRGASFTTTAWSSDGSTANTVSVVSNSGVSSKWDAGNGGSKCWQTAAFSTIGFHTIGVSAAMKSDNNAGPRDFNLEYSLDGGGSWSVINSFTVSSTASSKSGLLPPACQNKASVILRWINTSNAAVGTGSVIATGKSYIKTVSIGGLLPIIPATQAHDLTVVSRTPSAITVSWTKGNEADSIVVMMNTTNSFTPLPLDNQTFTAMSGTYSSGLQVIYVGNQSSFTVNVPCATDHYYFRAFDFQTNNGMARYITTSTYPDGVVLNPILCDLEIITLNTPTFGLISAHLGATIAIPKSGQILERGISWSTTPNVNESNGTLVTDYTDADGSFSFDTDVPRSSMIYFKGFVMSEYGTNWSDEGSFSNQPIFTGTGNWEDETKWNVSEVPGSTGTIGQSSEDDSPIINGNCTLSSTNSCTVLSITNGSKLTILPAKSLTVVGNLINNAGQNGLLIKASPVDANGSLIFPQGLTVPATVEMYSKASINGILQNTDNSKYKWQYFGIPVSSMSANPTFYGAYVRYWNEEGDSISNHWKPLNTSSTLSPFVGYEICQSSPKIYSFSGNLISDDFSQTNLAYTSSALYPGQHIFANPYTAAIDIRMLDTAFGNNIEQAVYLYNSGSFSEWENNNGEITHDSLTTTPGQYTVSTPFTAGVGGVPSQIPSMQAFLVKAKSNDLSNSHLSFNYSSVLVKNSERQRAQRQKVGVSDEQMLMRIEVLAEKTSDQMWFFVDQSRSRKFDNGWDGRKLLGSSLSPQLYAMEDDGFYQIDALNDLNNCEIGFKRGVDTEYTLKITHNNLNKMYSNIYLQDLVENKVVDVTQSGVEFKFSAQSNPTITKRFKLLVRYHEKNANGEPVFLKAFSSDKSIYVQNAANVGGEAIVYDLFGHYINKYSVTSNSISKLPVILSSGVYLVKTLCATEIFTQRITVR